MNDPGYVSNVSSLDSDLSGIYHYPFFTQQWPAEPIQGLDGVATSSVKLQIYRKSPILQNPSLSNTWEVMSPNSSPYQGIVSVTAPFSIKS